MNSADISVKEYWQCMVNRRRISVWLADFLKKKHMYDNLSVSRAEACDVLEFILIGFCGGKDLSFLSSRIAKTCQNLEEVSERYSRLMVCHGWLSDQEHRRFMHAMDLILRKVDILSKGPESLRTLSAFERGWCFRSICVQFRKLTGISQSATWSVFDTTVLGGYPSCDSVVLLC